LWRGGCRQQIVCRDSCLRIEAGEKSREPCTLDWRGGTDDAIENVDLIMRERRCLWDWRHDAALHQGTRGKMPATTSTMKTTAAATAQVSSETRGGFGAFVVIDMVRAPG